MWKDFGLVDLHSSIHPLPTPQSEAGTMHVPYPERILSMCEKEADKFAWKRKQNSKLRWVSLNSRTNALLQLPYVDAHSCWLRKKRENLFFDESNCTFPELKLIIFCVILSLPTSHSSRQHRSGPHKSQVLQKTHDFLFLSVENRIARVCL